MADYELTPEQIREYWYDLMLAGGAVNIRVSPSGAISDALDRVTTLLLVLYSGEGEDA
jgi:hypothetical protein